MSYNSKYTGQQVEELLDQVASGGTGGEGGGSAGGSNVYTLDIGEWDGVSNIDSIPITKEVLDDLIAADCVRIKYIFTGGDIPMEIIVSTEAQAGIDIPEYGLISDSFLGQDHTTGRNIILNVGLSDGVISCYLESIASNIPYQPVFGIGVYDAETDSWMSLTEMIGIGLDVSGVLELNKTAYNRIKEIGYDGIIGGMINSPLVFQFLPLVFEPVMLFMDNEEPFRLGVLINAKKNDGTISTWGIFFNEDGTETYTKGE